MSNKVILITGATGALGTIAAHKFATRGHSLVLLHHEQSELDALRRDLDLSAERLFTSVVDLRDGDAVRAAANAVSTQFGGIHALIHLVGGWVGGKTIAETPIKDFESMLSQHAWTTFYLFKEFGPHMAANKWGRVIVVSAPTANNPTGKTSAYTAAKAAQENLVLTFAAELKESNVTANIIQVRSIDVEGNGKGSTPKEIVASMLYLCSDEAQKINGARIPLF